MNQRWKAGKILLFSLVLLITLATVGPLAASEPAEIRAADLKALMDKGNTMVIFPLSRIEFNNLHIAGSVHIELEDIPGKLPADLNQTLVFYCLGTT